MNGAEPAFVDTNVFVYALSRDEAQRSATAQALLDALMESNALRTSTQVLQELFVTTTRKMRRPLTATEALHYLDQIAVWPVAAAEYADVRAAALLSESARLSFWDALIIIVAVKIGAKVLYSEDLQDGQTILGVRVVNPFRGK